MKSLSKYDSPDEKIDDMDIFKGFDIPSGNINSAQNMDYKKIRYEEMMKEIQKDTKILFKGIIETYLELIGERDTYEGRKEQERLEKLSPIVVLDLVKKRFNELQQEANIYSRRVEYDDIDNEKMVDYQISELTEKNSELHSRLQHLKERVNGLIKCIDDENKMRVDAAVHSRTIVEGIREEKRKLERLIREKDVEIEKIKNNRTKKEKLEDEIESPEQRKKEIKKQINTSEKKITKRINNMQREYPFGLKNVGKRKEFNKDNLKLEETKKKQKDIEVIERQSNIEPEQNNIIMKKPLNVSSKQLKFVQKEKKLKEDEKIETGENVRLKKDLETQKKLNIKLNQTLKMWEDKLKNDVQSEAKKIYQSIKKDVESVILSKTKQDDYVEEILSSHTRLSPGTKDMIMKERDLARKLEEKEAELKRLKKNHLIQRTQLWQEKPITKKDIKLLSNLLPLSTRTPIPDDDDQIEFKSIRPPKQIPNIKEQIEAVNRLFSNAEGL